MTSFYRGQILDSFDNPTILHFFHQDTELELNEALIMEKRKWPNYKVGDILILLVLFAGFFVISSDSYWIDEGNAMLKATQPSFIEWFRVLISEGGSDCQMPGYMLYLWLWEKIANGSEWVMRLSNLPWLIIACYSFRSRPMVILLLALSPFTVYYINELRPYAMQIAGGAILVGSLGEFQKGEGTALKFLLGLFILCASSLLGVLWSFAAIIYLVKIVKISVLREKFLIRGFVVLPLFAVLGVYYFWTLIQGHGAASVGGRPLLSLAQVVYEILGFSGLGPGRIELREDLTVLKSYLEPILLMAMVLGGALLYSIRIIWKNKENSYYQAGMVSFFFIMAVLVSLMYTRDFRLLGRHCAPMLAVYCLVLSFCISNNEENYKIKKVGYLLGILVFLGFLMSSFSLRLAQRHRKDDYRSASDLAKEAVSGGKKVYWLADRATGKVYGLHPELPEIVHFGPWEGGEILPGSLLIISKPDVYDSKGLFKKKAIEAGYSNTLELQAFSIWKD